MRAVEGGLCGRERSEWVPTLRSLFNRSLHKRKEGDSQCASELAPSPESSSTGQARLTGHTPSQSWAHTSGCVDGQVGELERELGARDEQLNRNLNLVDHLSHEADDMRARIQARVGSHRASCAARCVTVKVASPAWRDTEL